MNRKEIYRRGYTYIVTRRFLDKSTGRMRVRVTAYKGLLAVTDRQMWTDYRDFDDMHEGDRIFGRHIATLSN